MNPLVLLCALENSPYGLRQLHQLQLGGIEACLIKCLQGTSCQVSCSNTASSSGHAPNTVPTPADCALEQQQVQLPLQPPSHVQRYKPQHPHQLEIHNQQVQRSTCRMQQQPQGAHTSSWQPLAFHYQPLIRHDGSLQPLLPHLQLQTYHHAHQLQQSQAYHPATHRARLLTSKLLQQKSWQDLQLMYDTNGGGVKLNAIHLATVLQQLVRLAPAPELAPAAERQRLKDFTAELVAACHAKLHQFDHRSLAGLTQSLVKLGYDVSSCHPPALRSTGSSSSSSSSSSSNSSSRPHGTQAVLQGHSLLDDLLHAVMNQLPHATSQSCSLLCSALANLMQQQQQVTEQDVNQSQREQQRAVLQDLLSCMVARLRTLAAAGSLSTSDASKATLAACRLAAAIKAASQTSAQGAAANSVTQELQSLVLLAAEQAVQTTDSTEIVLPISECSQLLYTLAKTKVHASSDCVLGLVRQYSLALHDLSLAGSTTNASKSISSSRQYKVAVAAAPYYTESSVDNDLEAAARSLPPTMWAVGRLLELQQTSNQQQQPENEQEQQLLLQQLQYCTKLWQELGASIAACTAQLPSFNPVQLAQLANGLSKLVRVSRAKVAAADSTAGSSSSSETAEAVSVVAEASQQGNIGKASASNELHAASKALSSMLAGAGLQRLQQQHVARVQGLLLLMPIAQRVQLADAYKQLGVELPRPVALVFERDVAAVQHKSRDKEVRAG